MGKDIISLLTGALSKKESELQTLAENSKLSQKAEADRQKLIEKEYDELCQQAVAQYIPSELRELLVHFGEQLNKKKHGNFRNIGSSASWFQFKSAEEVVRAAHNGTLGEPSKVTFSISEPKRSDPSGTYGDSFTIEFYNHNQIRELHVPFLSGNYTGSDEQQIEVAEAMTNHLLGIENVRKTQDQKVKKGQEYLSSNDSSWGSDHENYEGGYN